MGAGGQVIKRQVTIFCRLIRDCVPFLSPLTTHRDYSGSTVNSIKHTEVQAIISSLSPKKSSGYDLITGHILKALPPLQSNIFPPRYSMPCS
jgi:hypothetical protein